MAAQWDVMACASHFEVPQAACAGACANIHSRGGRERLRTCGSATPANSAHPASVQHSHESNSGSCRFPMTESLARPKEPRTCPHNKTKQGNRASAARRAAPHAPDFLLAVTAPHRHAQHPPPPATRAIPQKPPPPAHRLLFRSARRSSRHKFSSSARIPRARRRSLSQPRPPRASPPVTLAHASRRLLSNVLPFYGLLVSTQDARYQRRQEHVPDPSWTGTDRDLLDVWCPPRG